jgi:hypothetical protein
VHCQGADLEVTRQVALHDGHPFVGEPARADVARPVLEVVLDHESDLRTDVRACLHRGVDIGLSGVREMFYFQAPGARGGACL